MNAAAHRPARAAAPAGLLRALHHVAVFGDTDQIPTGTAIELRARGLVAGPSVAPFLTAEGCALLDQEPAPSTRKGTPRHRKSVKR